MEKSKIRKNIKRRPGTSSTLYFHKGTQEAIEKFQNTETKVEQEKIYIADIFPAFDKLVENLIYVHNFVGLYDTYDDLKNDCITFLYEALHKFDGSRGSKAFSYFSIVAKNFLIIKSKQRASKLKKNISIDDTESLSQEDIDEIEKYFTIHTNEIDFESGLEKTNGIDRMLNEIKGDLKRENEIACIDAIQVLFKNIENLPFHNKRAVFLYIKEYSNLNPKQLTMAIAAIKKHYRSVRGKYKSQIL